MAGYVEPERAIWADFRALPDDVPIQMLNLIELRALALYPADHPDHGRKRTGLEAYRAYDRAVASVLERFGGRQVWAGRPEMTLIGPAERERWDLVFVVEYPSAAAFMAMMRDAEYRQAIPHRTAAVADSRLVRLAPADATRGLGG